MAKLDAPHLVFCCALDSLPGGAHGAAEAAPQQKRDPHPTEPYNLQMC